MARLRGRDRVMTVVAASVVALAELRFAGPWLDNFVPAVALVIVAAFIIAALVASKLGRGDVFRTTVLVPVAVAAYVLVVIGNCGFDRGAGESHEVQVLAVNSQAKRHYRPKDWLFPPIAFTTSWRGRKQERIEVRPRIEPIVPGEILKVRVRPGAFGFPWVASLERPD